MLRKLFSVSIEEKTNYFLTWALVAVSGFPFFYRTQLFILALLAIALFIYFKRSIIFDTKSLNIFGFYFVVELLQVIIFKHFEPQTNFGTFMRLGVAFVVTNICGKNFVKYYINIIYFFVIISFIFFIPCLVVPGFFNFFVNIGQMFSPPAENIIGFYREQPTILIFTFDLNILDFRNPGPFWEQGAFAIFILFAMIFNLAIEKKILTKKNIVFSIGLFSTLSTSGFIAYFILVSSFYFVNETFMKKLIFVAIAFPLAFILYNSLDFLSSKISNNIQIAGEDNTSRFGSALSDFKDFSTSPIIGWGRGSLHYGGKTFVFFTEDQHRNNGLSSLLVTYGIFLFIFFFYNYYKSLKAICIDNDFNTSFAIFSMGVIFILGFSQTIFQYVFFQSIMFVHLCYNNQKKDQLNFKRS